eukprot:SAG25_NODE_239_length_11223_cov_67.665049_2_plen_85_part_00
MRTGLLNYVAEQVCTIYVAWASHHYKYSLCDFATTESTGDFQVMMYDKPWYHGPCYLVGNLLAILYVHIRDPGPIRSVLACATG